MTSSAWKGFVAARRQFQDLTQSLAEQVSGLADCQQALVDSRRDGGYPVETPVVYNASLDDVQRDSAIRLILVADNPGRREQAATTRRYLVGPSGKLAEKFFSSQSQLGIAFPSQALILNKTPIHTPRTGDLRELIRLGGDAVRQAVEESQRKMAALLIDFHRALAPVKVWISGYGEMKQGGIFAAYTECLRDSYLHEKKLKEDVRLYRHFSMNQFTIDLNRQALESESLEESLDRIGRAYRAKFLGW